MTEHKYVFTYKHDQGNGTYIEDFKFDSSETGEKTCFFRDEYTQVVDLIEKKVNKDNNLILFTGKRGAGKTSAMCSVKKYLEKSGEDRERLTDYSFIFLPMVDPSYFNQKTNILKVVLSSMFKEAKRIFQRKCDGNIGYESLLKSFDKAFTGLGSIESAEKGNYTLETLNECSEATDMKETMQELVDRFIDFWSDGKNKETDGRYKDPDRKSESYELNKKRRLVLIIDDVDMNVSYAAAMLEQIRKYLMLDHLIILMSANLGQLHNELIEYYCSAFQKTLKDANQSLMIEVEDLATKFLLKMIPASHRIHVENPAERLLETELQIVYKEEDDDKKEKTRRGPLQKMILTMIWERTRLLFFPKGAEKGENAKLTLHPIIPTNLRELSYFLEMLLSLKPLDYCADNIFKDLDSYERCKKNFYTFKDYFLKNWIPNRLPADEEWAFQNMPSDITEINKHLINSINIIGAKHKKWSMFREMDLETLHNDGKVDHDIYTMVSPNDPSFEKANEISDVRQQSSNCSYGDLLFMIDKYETYFESKEDRCFSDAIKIFYSMLLFETMFFGSCTIEYKTPEKIEISTFCKKELAGRLVPIQQLIGGTVYYPYHFKPVYSKYFDDVKSPLETKTPSYHRVRVEEKVNENCPMFTILYYGNSRPVRYGDKHIYDTTFVEDSGNKGIRHVGFDILSLLNNILNPWHTIIRSLSPENTKAGFGLKEWMDNIPKWGEFCSLRKKVDDKKKEIVAFPNSILPFYSVDMMLSYLRDSFPASDFITPNSNMRYEIMKSFALYYFLWFDAENAKDVSEKSISDLLSFYSEDVSQETKTAILMIKQGLSTKNPIVRTQLINQDRTYEILFNNWDILEFAMSHYKNIRAKNENNYRDSFEDVTQYKALIEEKVLGLYKQERIGYHIIHDLKKYDDVFEIYNYLVKTLWHDSIMDVAVRKNIQDQIHENGVGKFYNMLWDKTEDLMKYIDVDGVEGKISRPYDKIFNVARDTFLEEKFKSKGGEEKQGKNKEEK